jgi:putative transposase
MFDDEFEDDLLKEETHGSSLQPDEASYLSPDLDSYPNKSRQEAIARYELILFIRERLSRGWTQKNLDPLISEYFSTHRSLERPNWRTVVRWHKKLLEHEDTPVSLIDRHHNKGNRNRKLLLDHEHFFEAAINRYLQAKRPSVASAYRFYKDQCLLQGHNINPMSQRAFYDRIDKLNSYDVAVKRFGKYKADIMFGYKGSTIRPERVMQRVEIDHTPLDIILLDDETSQPVGRPYLTLLKDVYSGCLVGYHLTFKAPSYASVAKAICHAIQPKIRSLETWDIDWPCFGKIEVLVVDNGAEFWSKSLEQMCYELGINVQYNPVRKPWLKPFIERSFRTINDILLDELSGKTFRSIDARGEYNAVKNASIKLSVFVYAFEKWVAEVFNCAPDSRGLKIPSMSWQEGVERLPPAVLTSSEINDLPKLAGLKETRAIQPSGITFHYLRYDSDELSSYRKQYLSPSKAKSVTIKIDVDDLSRIFVYLPELEQYLSVPCVDQEYAHHLSFDQHLINQSFAKKRNRLLGKSDIDLATARDEIRKILENNDVKASSSIKTSTNKKAGQYKGYSNESVKNKLNSLEVDSNKPQMVDENVSELEALWESLNQ